MKRYFLFVLIYTLAALTILAQETDKIEYKNLVVEKDGFSVDVPKDFNLESFDEKDDEYRFYAYRSPDVYLFIKSDKKKEKKDQNKYLIEYANSNLSKTKNLALQNFDAMKYEFIDKEGFYQKIIIIPSKKRNIVFHAVSINQNNLLVKKFFSSLKFNGVNIPSILALGFFDEEYKIENKANDKSNNTIPVPSANFPQNANEQTEEANNKKDNATVGLKILSKRRPPYTDMARSYNLQGTVELKVTFLANGQIGSVSPVTKLPFGLTLNAIEATRQIKFEPPKYKGVPYNVTKTVMYSFTIY